MSEIHLGFPQGDAVRKSDRPVAMFTKTCALLAAFVASASAFSIAPAGLAPSAFRGNAVNAAPAAPRARAAGPMM